MSSKMFIFQQKNEICKETRKYMVYIGGKEVKQNKNLPKRGTRYQI